MNARYCYRCGKEFKKGEGYHLLYIKETNKLVPVCRDDRLCPWQRPGRASREAARHAREAWEDGT